MITLERLIKVLQEERKADLQEQVEFLIVTTAGRLVGAGIKDQADAMIKTIKYFRSEK